MKAKERKMSHIYSAPNSAEVLEGLLYHMNDYDDEVKAALKLISERHDVLRDLANFWRYGYPHERD
jgi:hypothetical protein